MNAKTAIENKHFIDFLENILKNSEQTFEEFNSSIWYFLCGLKWNEKVKLYNQLLTNKLTYNYEDNKSKWRKTNVGNLQYMIIDNLEINFMKD